MPEEPVHLTESKLKEEVAVTSSLLKMPVRKAVFLLAWPTIIAGLLENLATTIDYAMVGLLGPAELAGVGTAAMIFWVLSALGIGLSVAAMALVARGIGGGSQKDARLALSQSIWLSIISGIVIGGATIATAPMIVGWFGVMPDVERFSISYLRILNMGMVFFAIMSVASGALRGAGDTRTPMVIGLLANLIHFGLNYILIFGKFGMPAFGVAGAAMGTAVSYGVASIIYFILFFRNRLVIGLSLSDCKWDFDRARQVMRVAIPATIEQFFLQLGVVLYMKFIVGYGTTALSGYHVGMRVLSLSFIPNLGFSTAAGALIGQNLGAGRKPEAKLAGWTCLGWAMLSMCTIGLGFLLFSRPLADFFVDDPEVIELGALFIRIVAYCQPGMATYFTLAGALRGAGDTRSPLFIALLGMYCFRIPAAWVLTHIFHVSLFTIFALLMGDYLIRIICILLRYSRGKWLETRI